MVRDDEIFRAECTGKQRYTMSGATAAEIGCWVAERLEAVPSVSVRIVWTMGGSDPKFYKVWIAETLGAVNPIGPAAQPRVIAD